VIHVEVQRTFAAPPERVWARYTDHASWSAWAGFGPAAVVHPGVPAPNGIGAVRRVGPSILAAEEEVVAFEAPRRMAYRLVRGPVPLRDHLGEVEFRPDGGGTRVVWRVRCTPVVPATGWLLAPALRFIFARVLAGLARDLGA
jgi:uncharacterized protein YndB with AHSA1/START domain